MLNKRNKQDLVGLILQTEASIDSQNATFKSEIKTLVSSFKILKADVSIVRKVKLTLAYRFTENKRQFWTALSM